MKKTTTNTTYASYKSTNLNNYLNEQIVINAHDFLPSTSIFATTIDGELIDVINIKNRLPKDEKLKVVSVLLEFCAAETNKLTNQNK